MLRYVKVWTLMLATGLLMFTGTAMAANAVDPQDGSLDLARAVYDAMAGGHYAFAMAIVLVLVTSLVRKYGGERWKVLHTDQGAASLVLVGSFGSSLMAMLAGGGDPTPHMFWSSLAVAFGAAGGYAALKKLVIEPLAPRLPEWMRPTVVWLFEHESDTSSVTKETK